MDFKDFPFPENQKHVFTLLGILLQVHYTARFADGIVFDSSYKRARPLTMRLGLGKVVSFFSHLFYFLNDFNACLGRIITSSIV